MKTESATHTPGPWQLGGLGAVLDSRQDAIAVVGFSGKSLAEQDANARLIAAAPELLAVLKAIVMRAEYDEEEPAQTDSQLAQRAKAAIAKAEGRE